MFSGQELAPRVEEGAALLTGSMSVQVMQRQHLKRPVFAMWNMQEFGIQIEWTITSDKNTIDDTKHKINTKQNTKPNNACSDL